MPEAPHHNLCAADLQKYVCELLEHDRVRGGVIHGECKGLWSNHDISSVQNVRNKVKYHLLFDAVAAKTFSELLGEISSGVRLGEPGKQSISACMEANI